MKDLTKKSIYEKVGRYALISYMTGFDPDELFGEKLLKDFIRENYSPQDIWKYAQSERTCEWTKEIAPNGNDWNTECGEEYYTPDGDDNIPSEYHKYCPHCGGKIVTVVKNEKEK